MLRAAASFFSVLAIGFIFYLAGTMFWDSFPALKDGEIFHPGYWDFRLEHFNSLSMFYGTAVVSLLALLFAFPIGLGAAIYISEYLSGSRRAAVKITIELLAGVPSVVYGLIGVAVLLPLIGPTIMDLGGISGDSLLAAGLLLCIMILPTVMTFSDDALRCVPRNLREEGLGLGLSKTQVISSIVIPKARTGIAGAVMLGLGRAIGETIAIYLVVGRSDQPFRLSDLSLQALVNTGQTLTTKLGGSELAIAYGDASHWQALMSLAVCLWAAVGLLSLLSEHYLGRDR